MVVGGLLRSRWRSLNWYVAFHYPTDTWVNFKVWGGIGLFLAFALVQGLLLARHVVEPKEEPQ